MTGDRGQPGTVILDDASAPVGLVAAIDVPIPDGRSATAAMA